MIDKKIAIVTIHDVNPSCAEKLQKTTNELNKLDIKYNLSIVPNYKYNYNLKDNLYFCEQISTLLYEQKGNIELTQHGFYHELDGKIEDYDSESKEEEKNDIKRGLDILSSVKLPKPTTFIPPSWYLSSQSIEALKDSGFNIAESMSALEFINEGKKYLTSPVMN